MFLDGLESSSDNPALFLGEGNFSFSASVVRMKGWNDSSHIWASCFESDPSKLELNKKNQEALTVKEDNKQFLESRGCRVLEGLDAERLEEDPRLSGMNFSKIIFMFPHVKLNYDEERINLCLQVGGKMKIDKNRRLLLNIIKSSRKVVAEDGEIIITLCKGEV